MDRQLDDIDFTSITLGQAHEYYKNLRACPVHKSERMGSFYWLSKYKDVKAAANDPNFSSARKGVMLPPDTDARRAVILEMEGAEHHLWKRFFQQSMSPARMRDVEDQLVAHANALIDKFAARGSCDLMKDFSQPLPVMGVCSLIGVSGLSVERIRAISKHYGDDPATREDVVQQLGTMLLGEVLERRANPRDDYLTMVAQCELPGRLLTDDEIIRLVSGFLVAGHETTTSAMGSTLFHALSNADLRARMLEDDRAIDAAVEEAVRLYPPFHAFHRTTEETVIIDDVEIPADSTVRLCYASANRDPDAFERPNEFDIDRPKKAHLGFGFGRHICPGAPFSRLEIRTAFKTLLKRLPDIHCASDQMDAQLIIGTVGTLRTLKANFTPAR